MTMKPTWKAGPGLIRCLYLLKIWRAYFDGKINTPRAHDLLVKHGVVRNITFAAAYTKHWRVQRHAWRTARDRYPGNPELWEEALAQVA